MILTVWLVAFAASLVALVWALRFYKQMMLADEGTDLMKQIATYVREGADAYLWQQYRLVTIAFVFVAILLSVASYQLELLNGFVPIAFLTGGLFSGLCGWFGMKTATQASSRTAAAARSSLNDGLQVAFRSGAVMGLTVVGMGLLYICLWFAILYWLWPMFAGAENAYSLEQISVAMLSFGMGASAQALFARVGGGIFTKAADVGADLVGKVEESMEEDSPNNPATIADNVGDNVGDVAGMGADLYESYCGSILAASALGAAAFASPAMLPEGAESVDAQMAAMLLPIAIAAAGILASITGIYAVRTGEEASQKQLLKALSRGINLAAVLMILMAVGLAFVLMPAVPGTLLFGTIPGIALSVIVGLMAGWLIGKWTEYVTSDEFKPTQRLAKQAETGPATIIIGGIADGMMSTWVPVIVVCAATLAAFGAAAGGNFTDISYFSLGLYGVGIAAVGMLSTLGITLATDAYGPIADNAGGNAEMAKLEKTVRQRTDALDSLGNTTAATGKGFAIGSAALTALALLAAYVEGVRDGFERWGHSAATQLVDDGYYKLSPGFMLHREGEQTTGYLVQPRAARDPRVAAAWHEVSFAAGPAKLSDETFLRAAEPDADGAATATNTGLTFTASGAALVPLRTASLQDFTEYYDTSLMNPRVLVGLFLGAMATFVFCALTMKAVGNAAEKMVVEVRRQLAENPLIKTGEAKPDYKRPVQISTTAAQRQMLVPSVLGLVLPIVVGLLLGVGGVLGLLVGCLTSGFCVAIFMANSGGSWDNAKKYYESGHLDGKGSDGHKAAVVGDTVGDPFKDTSGPSLNILIKLMSMVSVVVAGLIVRYSLISMGWF
ncbi:sodium-translocating pyrophosphatase [Roseimaritima ulvae]|uniref:Putative K(+)-stimulated pyrophosphate-energized sodium pump n=1 Tax=Roseimaritima ulvae TaxID=980254 RepID=A0A5B9R018_9BACT|nr:sodium-translocating pyrophosphatase [Roseimaritima ulvae]QEG42756.1 Putative K(+)-stimulated pyrophosphate-energized sodium pump [Roseimaritima ulvae]